MIRRLVNTWAVAVVGWTLLIVLVGIMIALLR